LIKQFYIFLFAIILVACNQSKPDTELKKEVKVKKPQEIDKEALTILNELYKSVSGDTILIIDRDTLYAYEFFGKIVATNQLNFTNAGKLNQLGDTLFSIIKNARDYGLYAEEYHFKTLDSLKNNFYNKKDDNYNVTNIAKYEVLLTNAYLMFGAHLNKARFA